MKSKWYVVEMPDKKIFIMQMESFSKDGSLKLWQLDGEGGFYLPDIARPPIKYFGKLLAIFDDLEPPQVYANRLESLVGTLAKRQVVIIPLRHQ